MDLIAHVDGDADPARRPTTWRTAIEEALQRAYPEIVDVVVHLEPEVGAHGR